MTGKSYPAAPTARVFSGIQPTGHLTLGNYLGAIRNWVPLQREFECLYCIVDLHAITMFQEPAALHAATRQVAAALIACGIDPTRHILFNQSLNPDHAELAWYFNCVARMGWLSRMTQFKEKAGKDRERASAGLFVYPNLMAADILAYRANRVPVGEDQKQHLELANSIADKFNHDWEVPGYFPEIDPLILGEATRVMSLRDGTKKMSKSDPSDMSRINLTDTADQIAQKIRKAKTDPEPLPTEAAGFENRPEARNLVTIYAALTDKSVADALAEVGGQGFGDFKKQLADAAVAHLSPITEEMNRLLADPAEIDATLFKGGEKARALSRPVLAQVRDILGFVHSG
ncbi:tryptophan--tRNA ligase [Marivibrio halodurans]|uniref:Tryptophan--tRNA ligase n=1 Tax=Marivibrio halodurans TaxID=2039722 RepID=A0A8J7V1H8_9PROT|nr:tryptophan--tRNA ligase [Marivibrio halodurans]MBP5856365.1 tryptophan--tRNA ligase [Marivibrio halodurans]